MTLIYVKFRAILTELVGKFTKSLRTFRDAYIHQISCNSHQTASHQFYRQSKRANRIAKQVNADDEKRGYGAEEMFLNIDRKDRGLKTSYFPYSTVPLKMKYSTFLAEKQTKEKR